MSLRIRYQHATGASLGYSVERLGDGTFFDNSTAAFSATPTTPIAALAEYAAPFLGSYGATPATPTAQWTNGGYCVRLHDTALNQVIGIALGSLHNGDDQPFSATITPATATIAVGSTPSSVTVSGLPLGKSYYGQHLYYPGNGGGEARVIGGQSYLSGNYTFSFPGQAGTILGPFSAVTVGDTAFPGN